jgi:hypothetical protein
MVKDQIYQDLPPDIKGEPRSAEAENELARLMASVDLPALYQLGKIKVATIAGTHLTSRWQLLDI